MRLLSESKPVARKRHNCMACDILSEYLSDIWQDLTFTEKRAIARARKQGRVIVIGQKYVRQFMVDGTDSWTFKAIPEIHEICLRFELYEI